MAVTRIGTWGVLPALIVTIVGFTALAVFTALLASRAVPRDVLHRDNDVKGFVLSVIGVLYAVLLGFVAVGVWERFDQAETRTFDEATNLQEIYRDAGSFAGGDRVRNALGAYVTNVVDVWPEIAGTPEAASNQLRIERIDEDVRALTSHDQRSQGINEAMLASMRVALEDRQSRMTMSSVGIEPIMWAILFAGGALVVIFSALFGFEVGWMRPLVNAGLGLTVGLVLFLAASLDYPFRGAVHVQSRAFDETLSSFHEIDSAVSRCIDCRVVDRQTPFRR